MTQAQSPAARPVQAYDYLILVDTSFSMAREKQALAESASDLIRSTIAIHSRPGAQLGLWTFNEQVHTARFPVATWTPGESETIAGRAGRFLRNQRFEKRTRIDKAVAEILQVVKACNAMTVFVLSDGDTPVIGTPFDRSLNLLYRENFRELHRARKPFITTLVAREGQFVAWSVSTDAKTVKAPEWPATTQTPNAAAPAQTAAANESPTGLAPPDREKPSDKAILPTRRKQGATLVADDRTPAQIPSKLDDSKPSSTRAEPGAAKTVEQTETISTNLSDINPPPVSVQPKREQSDVPIVAASKSEAEILRPDTPLENPSSSRPTNLEEVSANGSRRREEADPDAGRSAQSRLDTSAATNRVDIEAPSPVPVGPTTVAAAQTISTRSRLAIGGIALLLISLGLLYWSIRSHRHRSGQSLISQSLDRGRK